MRILKKKVNLCIWYNPFCRIAACETSDEDFELNEGISNNEEMLLAKISQLEADIAALSRQLDQTNSTDSIAAAENELWVTTAHYTDCNCKFRLVQSSFPLCHISDTLIEQSHNLLWLIVRTKYRYFSAENAVLFLEWP